MPNCYCLTRISNPEAGPVSRIEIDEELCKHFNVKPHPKFWLADWDNMIGFDLAMGHSFQRIVERYSQRFDEALDSNNRLKVRWYGELLAVTEYLMTRFKSDAWAEIGRR